MNRRHGREREAARHLFQVRRHRSQRLVEAERHVPGLAGEDREDRGQLDAELAPREQPHEEGDGEGQEPQDRHRLQNVEGRHDHHFRASAPRCKCRNDQREDERGGQGREHAERGAERIAGQVGGIERHRRDAQLRHRRGHFAGAAHDQHGQAGQQQEGDRVGPTRRRFHAQDTRKGRKTPGSLGQFAHVSPQSDAAGGARGETDGSGPAGRPQRRGQSTIVAWHCSYGFLIVGESPASGRLLPHCSKVKPGSGCRAPARPYGPGPRRMVQSRDDTLTAFGLFAAGGICAVMPRGSAIRYSAPRARRTAARSGHRT